MDSLSDANSMFNYLGTQKKYSITNILFFFNYEGISFFFHTNWFDVIDTSICVDSGRMIL